MCQTYSDVSISIDFQHSPSRSKVTRDSRYHQVLWRRHKLHERAQGSEVVLHLSSHSSVPCHGGFLWSSHGVLGATRKSEKPWHCPRTSCPAAPQIIKLLFDLFHHPRNHYGHR